jgi:CRP-like cAMP-binding protein
MEYAMASDAKSRLILELIITSKRFGEKNGKKISFDVSVSNLALSIGIARETVSRELKILKENNLIAIKNKKLTIIDIEKLVSEIS